VTGSWKCGRANRKFCKGIIHTQTLYVYSTNLCGLLHVCQQAETQNIAAGSTSLERWGRFKYVFEKDTNKA
jgi:hypothetical protein